MNCDEMRRELQRTLEGDSELPRNRCKDARRIIEYGGGEGYSLSLRFAATGGVDYYSSVFISAGNSNTYWAYIKTLSPLYNIPYILGLY